jgi:preprotein translocase subunit SecE
MKINTRKLVNYFKEVKTETKKVNWPTRKETIKYALVVIGISVAVAIFLGGLDFIFTLILNKLIL